MTKLNVVKRLESIKKLLEELSSKQAVIGVIDDGEPREGGLTNLELMAIHEFGSVTQNIPERPVLRIALAKNIDQVETLLNAKVAECLRGNLAVNDVYDIVGKHLRNEVLDVFGSSDIKALKEKTTKQRKHGGDKPLIDTGALSASISYEVRHRE